MTLLHAWLHAAHALKIGAMQTDRLLTYLKMQYKSVALLHANDKEAEKTIRETTIFTVATSNIKYLENIHF